MTSILLFAEDDVEVADEDEEIDDDEDDDEDYSEAEPLDFDTYYSFNDEDLDLDGGGGGHAGTSSGRMGGDNIYNNNDDPEFFVFDCLEVEKAQKTLQDQVTVVCNVTKVRIFYICSSFSKILPWIEYIFPVCPNFHQSRSKKI